MLFSSFSKYFKRYITKIHLKYTVIGIHQQHYNYIDPSIPMLDCIDPSVPILDYIDYFVPMLHYSDPS